MYLRCLAGDRPRSWLQWLPWAEYCYNTSHQTAIQCSPFRVVYGRDPPALISYHPGAAKVAAVDWQLLDRDQCLEEIKDCLLQAQGVMKATEDDKRHDVVFQVGDRLWLRLHQHTAAAIKHPASSKLGPRFFGPFKVVERVGEVAYKLGLPAKACIHDAFHVSLLKPFEGTPPSSVQPLPDLLHRRVVPTPKRVVRACLVSTNLD